jgi:glyoxylase-like metal-dependent hydrolase (beta-lactamase superfamily II)
LLILKIIVFFTIVSFIAVRGFLQLRPNVDVTSSSVAYNSPPGRNSSLSVRFFGTSTILITDGSASIMTDGFFSRPSFFKLATSIFPDAEEIDFALQNGPSKIDAIFVAHSHHDHAMDSGVVAQKKAQ